MANLKGYLKDSNNNELFISDNYFSDEVIVGTWIDGKPLYRKVIDTKCYNGIEDWKPVGTVDNVSRIVRMDALMQSGANYNETYIIPSYHSVWNGIEDSNLYFNRSTGTLYEKHSFAYMNNKTLLVILEYTKITD